MSNNETTTDLAHLRPMQSDEIDLGQLIRNLIQQWQLIVAITVLGAIMGVAIALLIPKQYRVEVIFDKPSTTELAPLLAQPFIELDRQQILASFLKNLKSRELIETVLTENNLLKNSSGAELTPQEKFTKIRNLSAAIKIAPAEYDFLPELEDTTNEIDQISYSILTADAEDGKTLLNGLLERASQKTVAEFSNDINGAKSVALSKLNNQLTQIEKAAIANQLAQLELLQNALSTAKALNISEPTSWEGIENELYLKGTKALTAEIESLKAAKPTLGSLTFGYDKDGLPLRITADAIAGQLGALENYTFTPADVEFIPSTITAQIPSDAEKPNRALIAIAATVLAGFLGLFIALIRIAIKSNKNGF